MIFQSAESAIQKLFTRMLCVLTRRPPRYHCNQYLRYKFSRHTVLPLRDSVEETKIVAVQQSKPILERWFRLIGFSLGHTDVRPDVYQQWQRHL
jgi:hypothetical protein